MKDGFLHQLKWTNLYKAAAVLILSVAISAAATIAAPGPYASVPGEIWTPSASESYFRALLYRAKYSETRYWAIAATDRSEIDMESSLDAAIEAWTILWRSYGYSPAAEKIRQLAALAPGVRRNPGFTGDLSMEADATPMELKNPAFRDYTMYLFRVVNRHHETLEMDGAEVLILDSSGKWWRADELTAAHPLWRNVNRLADTYKADKPVFPGRTVTFKQVYASPNLTKGKIRLILLVAGARTVEIPYLENLSSFED